jgi:hypothetical protein
MPTLKPKVGAKVYCLDPSAYNEGCFYRGRKYSVVRVDKSRTGELQYITLSCEAGCPHRMGKYDYNLYFRMPQIKPRKLPKWW